MEAINRLDPSLPVDERIAHQALKIVYAGLSKQPIDTKPISWDDADLATKRHTDRAKLVQIIGKNAKNDQALLAGLVQIAERDADHRARHEAVQGLGTAQWKPRKNTDSSFVVDALVERAVKDPNPIVRKKARSGLADLHSIAGAYTNDPRIIQAVFPLDLNADDFIFQNRMQALLKLGLHKPHVTAALEGTLNKIADMVKPENEKEFYYGPARERLDLLLSEVRRQSLDTSGSSQSVAMYQHWEPILKKLASHKDPQIQMDAIATQLELAIRANKSVVAHGKTFPEFPKHSAAALWKQVGGLLDKLGDKVHKSKGDAKIAGIELMGEFGLEHPDAMVWLNDIGKQRENKDNKAVQFAIAVERIRNEDSKPGDLDLIMDAVVAKAPGHEELEDMVRAKLREFPETRNGAIDLYNASEKAPFLQNRLEYMLSDYRVARSLTNKDDRTVNFYAKQSEKGLNKDRFRNAIQQVPLDNLSTKSKNLLTPLRSACGPGNESINAQLRQNQ